MGLRVKTNIDSLVAQRRLDETRKQLGESLEKLSSGQRINKSADDAAGLAVSRADPRRASSSLGVAKRNASDGISYIQVAEGGLNEVDQHHHPDARAGDAGRIRHPRARASARFLTKNSRSCGTKSAGSSTRPSSTARRSCKPGDGDKPIQIFVGASNRGKNVAGDLPDIDKDNDPDVLTIKLDELARIFKDALEAIVRRRLSDLAGPGRHVSAQELGPDGDTNELVRQAGHGAELDRVLPRDARLGAVAPQQHDQQHRHHEREPASRAKPYPRRRLRVGDGEVHAGARS